MDQSSIDTINKLYCWIDPERECGSDCVVFDRKGALDTSGKHTQCLLCNHLDGICKGTISIAKLLSKLDKNKRMPGTDIPPPSVGGF